MKEGKSEHDRERVCCSVLQCVAVCCSVLLSEYDMERQSEGEREGERERKGKKEKE